VSSSPVWSGLPWSDLDRQARAARSLRRHARVALAVPRLRRQGKGIREIAPLLEVSRNTVRRYV